MKSTSERNTSFWIGIPAIFIFLTGLGLGFFLGFSSIGCSLVPGVTLLAFGLMLSYFAKPNHKKSRHITLFFGVWFSLSSLFSFWIFH